MVSLWPSPQSVRLGLGGFVLERQLLGKRKQMFFVPRVDRILVWSPGTQRRPPRTGGRGLDGGETERFLQVFGRGKDGSSLRKAETVFIGQWNSN